MVSIDRLEGFDWITIIELSQNAALTSGKNIILDIISKVNLPAIIFDYETIPPKTGDRIIISKKLEHRCNSVKGKFLTSLTEDVNIFELLKNK